VDTQDNFQEARILLVDDTEENLYVLERILRRYEYENLRLARSGQEALEIIHANKPDLVLLDVHMPQMDGFEVCEKIKEDANTSDVAVIFLTARYKDLQHKVHGLEVGGDDYITKPFVSQELIARVQVALRLKYMQDQLRKANEDLMHSQQELRELADRLADKVVERTAQLEDTEEKYRLLMEKANDVIFLIQPDDGKIVETNEKAIELLGYSLEQITNMILMDLMPGEEPLKIDSFLKMVSRQGKSSFWDVRVKNKSGKELIMDINAGAVNYRGSHLIQAIFHDQTERKRMQEQLIQNERLASMGALAAGVAHEINNPLSIIQGFVSEVITRMKEEDPYWQELHIINDEVMRLSQLVRDLMTFARPQKASPTSFKLATLLERAKALLRARIKKANVNWNENLPGDVPNVYADDGQLLQVIINVILNALDAMPDGGNLSFSTKWDNDKLRLMIADSGKGISAEIMGHLFDPFFTTKEGKGSGLGLVICKQLLEENNGEISLESFPEKGTTVTITLPKAT